MGNVITAAARMDQLIQDVLTFSRVTRERVRLEPVDLEKLLRQIIQENPALQPPNADVFIAQPLIKVMGHEASLTQCLLNLLLNAVKFVAPGVQPLAQDELTLGGDVALVRAVRARVWLQGRWLARGLETTEDACQVSFVVTVASVLSDHQTAAHYITRAEGIGFTAGDPVGQQHE